MPRCSFVALIACGFGLICAPALLAAETVTAIPVGRYVWQMDDPNFGGLSGLEVTPDGQSFTAITDRGSILTGHFLRNDAGAIIGVGNPDILPLKDLTGKRVRRRLADPEGLAIDPNGRMYVSFEADHRVWAYAGPGATAEEIPQHDDFAAFQENSAMEALAIDADGRLYTLPERSGHLERPFPVYRYDGSWSQPFTLPRDQDFMPVGADFGPDGQFYLLERAFRPPFGFYARVSRFELTETGAGPREVLLETTAPFQNNFEGLSVWQDTEGALRLTLLSDDNFLDVLTTEFAEYRLVTD